MSYDISLVDPVTKEVLELDCVHSIKGGTYASEGTNLAILNITWNYAPFFYNAFGSAGIRTIYGKTGAESISILKNAMSKLKNDASDNYGNITEGNAKSALAGLLSFAQLRPDGIWEGD